MPTTYIPSTKKGNNLFARSSAQVNKPKVNDEPNQSSTEVDAEAEKGIKKFKGLTKKVIKLNMKLNADKTRFQPRPHDEAQGAETESQSFLRRTNSLINYGADMMKKDADVNQKYGSKGNKQASTGEEKFLDDCCPQKISKIDCFPLNYFIHTIGDEHSSWTKTRLWFLNIVSNPTFEWVILVLILGSSITLCFEDKYLDQNPTMKIVLFSLNTTFTALFVLEMFAKWIALGLKKYFTSFWTLLDFIIVAISLISFGFDIMDKTWLPGRSKNTVASLKALRTFRALRPLRAIPRWQGMKIVVNALVYSIPSIFNVMLVCLLFWLIFSIVGVQLFRGRFYRCVDEEGNRLSDNQIPDKESCCANPDYSWVTVVPNFNNVLEGYLALFQVATFEGWLELMAATADVTDVGKNMKRESNYTSQVYYVIFIIMGSFFTLNLLVGVIVDNFNVLKKKYEGTFLEVLLTPSQQRYYTAMKKLSKKKPIKVIKRPTNKFYVIFYDLSMSRKFEILVFALIFVNMFAMGFEYYGQPKIQQGILKALNLFFGTAYAVEALIKLLGLRLHYFTVPWNIFDFMLVMVTFLDLFIAAQSIELPFPPTMLRLLRVFRIGRVLRIIKASRGIRKLLFALIVSLPALFNIMALLLLITFIYAILGMTLFKDGPIHGVVDEVFNFTTFLRAMLMLLRLLTAAGWNDVLEAMTLTEPECGTYKKVVCDNEVETLPNCLSRLEVTVFMVTYIILTYLIVINMYTAVILENFMEAIQEDEIGIVEDDLDMFYIRWSRYDPQATQFISFDQLSEFLSALDSPLGIPKPNMVAIVAFNLPIARGNKIHCLDIIHAVVKHALGQVEVTEEFRKLQDEMEEKFRKKFPGRHLIEVVSSTRIWKIQHNAAIIIQRTWRSYMKRKRQAEKERLAAEGGHVHGGKHKKHHTQGQLGQAMNKIGGLFHTADVHAKEPVLPFLFTHTGPHNHKGPTDADGEDKPGNQRRRGSLAYQELQKGIENARRGSLQPRGE